MRRNLARRFAGRLVLLAGTVLVTGCPSVPKEAVELSYQVGQDLDILHDSYRKMVVERFADFRGERLDYLENEWIPTFLADWIREGELVATAKGELVWSNEASDFVAPTPGRERQQLLFTVMTWSDEAQFQIAQKRAQLLDPLAAQERAVLQDLDASFDRLKRANDVVTMHLNSIREVQEVQQEALGRLGLDDVVANLNQGLIDVSNKAQAGLQEIRTLDGKVDEAVERAALLMELADEIVGQDEDGGGN